MVEAVHAPPNTQAFPTFTSHRFEYFTDNTVHSPVYIDAQTPSDVDDLAEFHNRVITNAEQLLLDRKLIEGRAIAVLGFCNFDGTHAFFAANGEPSYNRDAAALHFMEAKKQGIVVVESSQSTPHTP